MSAASCGCKASRRRRPFVSTRARQCSPTVRSSTARSSSAGCSCSTWRTSTRRPRLRFGSRSTTHPDWRSKCGRSSDRSGEVLEDVFREEWGRVLAALVGLLGDIELAEEAAQDAFATAAERWPRDGSPDNPAAWLIATGRNRAIDRIRRESNLARKTEQLRFAMANAAEETMDETTSFPDERLELIFTCCHPALGL